VRINGTQLIPLKTIFDGFDYAAGHNSAVSRSRQYERNQTKMNEYNKAKERLVRIFKGILPKHGFTVRHEQIDLALHILDELSKRHVTLAEAEVGTGKTLAYLIAAIIIKRFNLNDYRNTRLYPKMGYWQMEKMPIVVATSSIPLQKALITEYIPQLSKILMESKILSTPITAVLRKGKEHYVCERNLREHLKFECDKSVRKTLEKLLDPKSNVDLAEADITPYIKRSVGVCGKCSENCPHREDCRYLKYREQAQSTNIDIQVCNHNYFLADTLLRAKNSKLHQPLIPNYQLLIIDEAHKFLSAARSMYGTELSDTTAVQILHGIDRITFSRIGVERVAMKTAKKLSDQSAKVFEKLCESVKKSDDSDEAEDDRTENLAVTIDDDTVRHIRNVRRLSEQLTLVLHDELFYLKMKELLAWARDKYDVDTSRIDLGGYIAPIYEAKSHEKQREIMYSQMYSLQNAICRLPKLTHIKKIEMTHRGKRQRSNSTERQAVNRNRVPLNEAIERKVYRLFFANSFNKSSERISRLIWQIGQLGEQAAVFCDYSKLIYWLQTDKRDKHGKNGYQLCSIPKNLNERLFKDQWGKGIATVLTSGTLSANSDFTHVKRALGLDLLKSKVTETTHASPFDYRKNALLYISENVPFPDIKSKAYINAVADETEKLIMASHGHAAVLFTSYKVMDLVWEKLRHKLPFPLFRLGKNGIGEIEKFKKSDGGVLFASGAMWEGIDIPGDALSMVIIVKLPFAVPDPISEYERTLYPDFSAYRNAVITPEMLVKNKQGLGRGIRTEKDTCAFALLDSRVRVGGCYRDIVIAASPDCRVTNKVDDISEFMVLNKPIDYFDKDFKI
jgi:Rad3-related DNA helicase